MRVDAARVLVKLREWGPDRCLLALAGLLVLLLLAQGVRYGVTVPRARRVTRYLERSSEAAPKRDETKAVEDYKLVFEKGVLGVVKEERPQILLLGIMGDKALLGMSPDKVQLYEVGAKIQDDKIVEIGVDKVVLERDGNQRTIKVFAELKMEVPGGPPERGPAGPGMRLEQGPPTAPGAEGERPEGPEAAATEGPRPAPPVTGPAAVDESSLREMMEGRRQMR